MRSCYPFVMTSRMRYFCLKIYTGLGWLELQHRIMAAYFGASVVEAKSVLLSLAWIGLLKTFVFFS